MSDSEAFTLVTASSKHKIYDDYEEIGSGHFADRDTTLQKALRQQYPELSLTVTLSNNVSLLQFAAAGNATADLDLKDEAIKRLRYFYVGNSRRGIPDMLVESREFAKYFYKWADEYFIVYIVYMGYGGSTQYILKEPGQGESTVSRNGVTDQLVATIGKWQKPDDKYIYVFDNYWTMSKPLYEEIQRASWDNVILNESMKKALTELMHRFFDSEDIYKDLGVPWKRGVIFHGPVGNGKTISIKALMHSLFERSGLSIPSLYVKSASSTYAIRAVFVKAREMSPCLLIFEDIDTIVNAYNRSYFFNEVDGLENNDGIFMVASTNYLDRLDPGLSSRPSRFDRKYLFPIPSEEERVLYCEYWREKLKSKPAIKFPKKLSPAIAGITKDFSFAYLKEAFVATLLVIAGHRSEECNPGGGDDDGGDPDDYELWREMQIQVKLLRENMGSQSIVDQMSTTKGFESDLSWKEMELPPPPPREADTPRAEGSQPVHPSALQGQGQAQEGSDAAKASRGGSRRVWNLEDAGLITDDGAFVDSGFDGIRTVG